MAQESMMAREVYGKTLLELGEKDKNIVVLDADLSCSTKTSYFAKKFPERFFNFGVAEQNMMGVASGLASCGKIVFASSFAMFVTGRAWEQIRNTVCYNNLNVKIVATHAGITVGPDGASHQAIEDLALMRAIPNMKIIVPCDGPETRQAVLAAAASKGPVYIRLGRAKINTLAENNAEFILGKAKVLREGSQATVFACGIMVEKALAAAQLLQTKSKDIAVINLHTLRPLDKEIIIQYAKKTGRVVTCEEHLTNGGLGSSVAEVLSESACCPLRRIGIRESFGQSGDPEELLKVYGLTSEEIVKALEDLLK
jgi:transketolase